MQQYVVLEYNPPHAQWSNDGPLEAFLNEHIEPYQRIAAVRVDVRPIQFILESRD